MSPSPEAVFTETNVYRFGCPGLAWAGAACDREYEAYTAETPRDAWRYGQLRWLYSGSIKVHDHSESSTGEYTVVLERKVLAPAVLCLSGTDCVSSVTDKRPQQEIWMRVAVGEADTGWTGDKNGGIFHHVIAGLGTQVRILDPDLDLCAALLPILGDKDPAPWLRLRQQIELTLKKKDGNRHKYPKPDTPVWVIFTQPATNFEQQSFFVEMLFEEENFQQLCKAMPFQP